MACYPANTNGRHSGLPLAVFLLFFFIVVPYRCITTAKLNVFSAGLGVAVQRNLR